MDINVVLAASSIGCGALGLIIFAFRSWRELIAGRYGATYLIGLIGSKFFTSSMAPSGVLLLYAAFDHSAILNIPLMPAFYFSVAFLC